jgi:hypothetical protein
LVPLWLVRWRHGALSLAVHLGVSPSKFQRFEKGQTQTKFFTFLSASSKAKE